MKLTFLALCCCAMQLPAFADGTEFKGVPLNAPFEMAVKLITVEGLESPTCTKEDKDGYSSCLSLNRSKRVLLPTDRSPEALKAAIDAIRRQQYFTYASTSAIAVRVYGIGGRFEGATVTLRAEAMPETMRALRSKYGEPTSSKSETFKTKTGSEFANEVMTWERADSVIIARLYSASTEEGDIQLKSKPLATLLDRKEAETASAAKKDL